VAEPHAVPILTPLKFPKAGGESIMMIALEPLKPAELPKMVEGLSHVSKAYPMAKTCMEESGEHVLFGTGDGSGNEDGCCRKGLRMTLVFVLKLMFFVLHTVEPTDEMFLDFYKLMFFGRATKSGSCFLKI
jgi:hypothetical protein